MSWATAALGEVAKIERNSIAPTEIVAGSRYVGLEHIESGGASFSFGKVANGELASSKFRFGSKHILFGKLRPYLAKIVCPDFEGICSTDILPIAPGKRIDQRYLLHFLRRPETVAWASSRATGVNLPRLSPSELASLEVPLPPLDEQQRIAAILDKADVLRRNRKRALELLDGLTQSIFLETFEVALGDRNSFKKLSEVTKEIYRYPTYFGIEYVDSGVAEVRGELIQDDGTIRSDRSSMRFISQETSNKFRRTQLQTGDLVMSVRGTIGKIGQVSETLSGANITANLIRIAPNRRVIDPPFLWFSMKAPQTIQALESVSASTTIATVKASDLKELPIFCPAMADQADFISKTNIVSRHRETVFASLSLASNFFSSLQHRAFTGQL